MERKNMKKHIKIILPLVFAIIFILGVLWVRNGTWIENGTWERKVLEAEDKIEDSSNADVLMTNTYQKIKDTLYYVKEKDNVLLARQGGKEREICQNVSEFFIWEKRLYILDSGRGDLFWVSETGDRHIIMPYVVRAGVINDQLYIVTEEKLYYYDCDEQTGTEIADLTESEDGGVTISDTVFVNDYVVRLIPDKGIWVFSVKNRKTYMHEFPFKAGKEEFYKALGEHQGTVFLSVYRTNSEEIGSCLLTRKTNGKNGIYKYNLKTGEALKVSEQSGDGLFSIGKELYVVENGFFVKRLKKVNLKD